MTGAPAFFVHPCNTAEAMKSVALNADVQLEEYMLLWFGIVGGCAGLNVPPTLADATRSAGPALSILQTV